MDDINVRTIEPEQYPLWDKLVELSPYGTIFHTSKWLVTVGRESHVKTDFIGAFNQGQIVGGCAIHSYLFAGIFTFATTTLPLTPYGGLIITPHESSKVREKEKDEVKITQALLSEIQKKYRYSISLTMAPQVVDIRPYFWHGWIESIRYCYIFSLSGDIEKNISKNVRWSVNKAQKMGIIAKQKWDNDIYWNLTLNTYAKQGINPPFSRDFIFCLINMIQENQLGEMWIAETDSGEVAAAEIILWDSQMAYRWSAASHDKFKKTGATSFLLFKIMTHLQEKGYKKFNLMAANTPHLANFISSFNPDLIPYYSVQKSFGFYRMFSTMQSLIRLR